MHGQRHKAEDQMSCGKHTVHLDGWDMHVCVCVVCCVFMLCVGCCLCIVCAMLCYVFVSKSKKCRVVHCVCMLCVCVHSVFFGKSKMCRSQSYVIE